MRPRVRFRGKNDSEIELLKRNRTRKIIYFNPPFCESVKTNIGKMFFELISKHFNQNNSLNKLINKNNCKLAYSCMSNIKMLIQGHNKKKFR